MDQFALLPDDAVIQVYSSDGLLERPMFRVEEFVKAASKHLDATLKVPNVGEVSCQLLVPGMEWKKGRYRYKITLEFCPNEES